MEDIKISEQKSLEIITSMIQDTKTKIEKNSGLPFLTWGYTTVIVSILEFFVENQGLNPNLKWGWWLIPIIGWLLMIPQLKKRKKENLPSNFIDRAINLVWIIVSIATLFALPISIFGRTSILFTMTLFMGIGTALTGGLLKFRLLIISGFIGIIGSLAFSLPLHLEYRGLPILFFAAIFALMMIVPGHILNYKTNK
ncbi:MAG: hypothetical protein Q4F97_03615 [Bacteroidales bacterium]|nr:hypothetical protein [Bacteroidales bacterium]